MAEVVPLLFVILRMTVALTLDSANMYNNSLLVSLTKAKADISDSTSFPSGTKRSLTHSFKQVVLRSSVALELFKVLV